MYSSCLPLFISLSINVFPLFMTRQSTFIKFGLKTPADTPSSFSNRFYFQNLTSSIPNWLLSAHKHCMWKAYFSDLYLTYMVQSSLWVTTWGSLLITLPKLTLHIHLVPLFSPAALPLSTRDNLQFSGDQQGVGKPHGENNRWISYYYEKYLCTSQSSTNVLSSQHCWGREGC